VIVFKSGGSIFALTFAHGHMHIDDAKTESEFGLKVAVNALLDGNLRSVERSNIGVAIRDHAQAAGRRDLRAFGFDDALDLIRKVTGRGDGSAFAEVISGSRALRFSKKAGISDVPQAAVDALAYFKSSAYQKTAFKVLDFLSPVSDSEVEIKLDKLLVDSIRGGSDDFEIAIPEILPDRVASFRFENARASTFYPDLSLELYRESVGDRLAKLTIEDFKKHKVAAYDGDSEQAYAYWSLYHAMIGSLATGGERYALNEGAWYKVGKRVREAADRKFESILRKPDGKLRTFKQKSTEKKKGKRERVTYQSEESYNKEIATESGYLLLDTRLVQIDEKPGPGFEVCDLLDVAGRRFIHVKKSSRQSSVLSHLFKQGGVSAQMLKKYEPFKAGLIEKVRKHYDTTKASEVEAALAQREPWTVEFQIADYPRKDGKHNIPFFSKLTLQEEAGNLEAMGFDVKIGFISLSRLKHRSKDERA
jgi:uncharacterized protein (TIGR04141 family)